jgi:hypothetical protein
MYNKQCTSPSVQIDRTADVPSTSYATIYSLADARSHSDLQTIPYTLQRSRSTFRFIKLRAVICLICPLICRYGIKYI